MSKTALRFMVCYDIQCQRVRAKVAKKLEQLGTRVQYSVFEVQVYHTRHFTNLFDRLCTELQPGDSLRGYYLHPQTLHRNVSNHSIEGPPAYVIW